MDLYERIREIAKSKNISINQMEKELGFARSYLSKLRTVMPSADNLQRIADYLNIPIDQLIKKTEKPGSFDGNTKEDVLSYDAMLKIYTRGKNNLTPEEKIKLAQIILSDRND